MPKFICEFVARHHDPELFSDPNTDLMQKDLFGVLKLVDNALSQHRRGTEDTEWSIYKAAVLDHFGMSEEDHAEFEAIAIFVRTPRRPTWQHSEVRQAEKQQRRTRRRTTWPSSTTRRRKMTFGTRANALSDATLATITSARSASRCGAGAVRRARQDHGKRTSSSGHGADGSTATQIAWQSCEHAVELIRIDGGGHTWPGGDAYLDESRIGTMNRDFLGSEVMLDFFDAHPGS